MLEDLTLVVCLMLLSWYTIRKTSNFKKIKSASLPYPPGPPSKWFIGNLFDLPTSVDYQALLSWKQTYGDLTYFRAFGQSVLILNSLKAATDLLEGRGVMYAHRPQLLVAGELMGLNQGMAMMDFGPKQRLGRRLAHHALSAEAIKRYEPVLEEHTLLLLKQLCDNPDNFESAIRLTTGRNILAISYGVGVTSADSEYITDAEKVMNVVEAAIAPGAFLADLVPILKYIPSWMPFAYFKRFAERNRKLIHEFHERPYMFAKREIETGSAKPCLVSDILSQQALPKDMEENVDDIMLMRLIGDLYGDNPRPDLFETSASTGTTSAAILTFIMLMALNPEKQHIAQTEIDKITEGQRLPGFADKERLPYVCAMIKELLRWHAVVPLGLARQTRKPDVYNGFLIPPGTIVLFNLWAMGKTEGTSPDLSEFAPERFLHGKETMDPYRYIFGFGRRICPGRFLADSALFNVFSSILSCFNISHKRTPENDGGLTVPIPLKFTKHLISYPEAFVCEIRPRSSNVNVLIQERLSGIL